MVEGYKHGFTTDSGIKKTVVRGATITLTFAARQYKSKILTSMLQHDLVLQKNI